MKNSIFSRLFFLGGMCALAVSCVRQKAVEDIPDTDLTGMESLFKTTQPQMPPEQDLKATLLTVGGQEITYGDLVAESQRIAQASGIPQEKIHEFRERIVDKARDNLVLRALLLIGAERQGMQVNAEEVVARIGEIERGLPEGATLEGWMDSQGISRGALERMIGRDLLENKLRKALAAQASAPTTEEEDAFYKANPNLFQQPEGFYVESIRIPLPPKTAAVERGEVIRTSDTVRAKLADGATLDDISTALPKGAQVAPVFIRSQGAEPSIVSRVFSLKPGETSDVLVLGNACHIFRMVKKQEAGIVPMEEARPHIAQQLAEQKGVEQVTAFAKELQKTVEIRDGSGNPVRTEQK